MKHILNQITVGDVFLWLNYIMSAGEDQCLQDKYSVTLKHGADLRAQLLILLVSSFMEFLLTCYPLVSFALIYFRQGGMLRSFSARTHTHTHAPTYTVIKHRISLFFFCSSCVRSPQGRRKYHTIFIYYNLSPLLFLLLPSLLNYC